MERRSNFKTGINSPILFLRLIRKWGRLCEFSFAYQTESKLKENANVERARETKDEERRGGDKSARPV